MPKNNSKRIKAKQGFALNKEKPLLIIKYLYGLIW